MDALEPKKVEESGILSLDFDLFIGELRRLNRVYGKTTWRKRKGIAKITFMDGAVKLAELHWYEGHGKGKKEIKIKKYLE